MMHSLFRALSAMLIAFFPIIVSGQEFGDDYNVDSPSAATLMSFEETPVGLYTGVPDVSIPLYSVPTHSKYLTLNFGLSYHCSGAQVFTSSGDVGPGWSFSTTAAITRTVNNGADEIISIDSLSMPGDDLYQVSFFGMTSRFHIDKTNNNLTVRKIYSSPSSNNIYLDYNNQTLQINSFTIFDKHGNKYIFSNCDYGTSGFITTRNTWYLSEIYDINNKILCSYDYTTTESQTPTFSGNYTIHTNKLNQITVHDKAQIYFEYNGNLVKSLTIKDFYLNPVKRFDFIHTGIQTIHTTLGEIEVHNFINNEIFKYKFEYKRENTFNEPDYRASTTNYLVKVKPCRPDNIYLVVDEKYPQSLDPESCTIGVLERITFPTGGSIFYEYESNTLATYREIEDDPNYDLTQYSQLYHNNHKHIVQSTDNPQMTPNWFEFDVTTEKYYYFRINEINSYTIDNGNGEGIEDENGSNQIYPTMSLLKQLPNGSGFTPYSAPDFLFEDRYENYCYGTKIWLTPGHYRFDINPINLVNFEISERVPNDTIKEWVYDGGIRIKKVSYFNNQEDENPIKVVQYGYNLFDNPNKSSGAESNLGENTNVTKDGARKTEAIGYKNVTVWETGKGRTEYTFTTTPEAEASSIQEGVKPLYFYKSGLETKKRIFNENGQLLKEVNYDYTYNSDIITFTGDPTHYETNGFVKTRTGNYINHYYKSNGTHLTSEEHDFIENIDNTKIDNQVSYSSDDEPLKTQYIYENFVAPSTYNGTFTFQTELSSVKTFRNNELLSTKKTEFGQFPDHIDYLPTTILAAKGDGTLEPQYNFLSYDEYANPLEVKQADGITVSYVWGYNKTELIAKIENASYDQIATALEVPVAAIKNFNETNMTLLNNLRALMPAARVTTFTHIPLIGVSTITDNRGRKTTYEYDAFGRLKDVRDNEGNILTESTYHYQPQN